MSIGGWDTDGLNEPHLAPLKLQSRWLGEPALPAVATSPLSLFLAETERMVFGSGCCRAYSSPFLLGGASAIDQGHAKVDGGFEVKHDVHCLLAKQGYMPEPHKGASCARLMLHYWEVAAKPLTLQLISQMKWVMARVFCPEGSNVTV